jgi:hypothetical protein
MVEAKDERVVCLKIHTRAALPQHMKSERRQGECLCRLGQFMQD